MRRSAPRVGRAFAGHGPSVVKNHAGPFCMRRPRCPTARSERFAGARPAECRRRLAYTAPPCSRGTPRDPEPASRLRPLHRPRSTSGSDAPPGGCPTRIAVRSKRTLLVSSSSSGSGTELSGPGLQSGLFHREQAEQDPAASDVAARPPRVPRSLPSAPDVSSCICRSGPQ